MITFVSKLKLKPMSCLDFHQLVVNIHSLNELENKTMIQLKNGYILRDEHIIGYHIEDHWIYEYIYDETNNELLISLDKRNNKKPKELFNYLMKQNLLLKDNEFKIKDTPHYVNELPKTSILPLIYFNSELAKPFILNECSSKLKGLAHIVYGDEKLDELMKKHHHSSYQSYALLFNNDYLGFSKLKNESDESFIDRVNYKMQSYMTKRVFEYPFNMNELYQKALSKIIEESKNNEESLLEKYDDQLSRLEKNKQKYIEQIDLLSNKIEYLKFHIEAIENKINMKDDYPLLFKGNEKEFYEGEQKDMILSLIREELKTEKDPERIKIFHEILKENPQCGIRKETLENARKILLSCTQIGERQIEDLRKLGIFIDKGEKHLDCCFFDDPRYNVTISTSTSDVNTNRQLYRDFRNYYF